LQVFIACGIGDEGQNEDPFLKPSIEMWTLLKEHFNSGIAINQNYQ
jgi:bifunctional polynucleotide phosphatase/kinase